MEKAGWGFLSCCEDVGAVRGRFVLEPGAYRRECSACRITAHVAQSVEHLHGKQKVSGSIPLVGSTPSRGCIVMEWAAASIFSETAAVRMTEQRRRTTRRREDEARARQRLTRCARQQSAES